MLSLMWKSLLSLYFLFNRVVMILGLLNSCLVWLFFLSCCASFGPFSLYSYCFVSTNHLFESKHEVVIQPVDLRSLRVGWEVFIPERISN